MRLGILLIVLLSASALAAQQAQTDLVFRSPQHDIRVMLDMKLPQDIFGRFYNLNYGDTIQLGEFKCGDPLFLVNINESVKLTAAGFLAQQGTYNTTLQVATGLNAKIHETCFGIKQPSVGGTGYLNAQIGAVPTLSEIPLNGQFSLGPLAQVLGIVFPIKSSIKLPVKLDSIPVSLENSPLGDSVDFVEYQNGEWKPTNSPTKKLLPLYINVGSFGNLGTFSDGSSRGNSRLVFDETFSTSPRFLEFSGSDAQKKQQDDFQSDSPIPNPTNDYQANLGVSLQDSAFGYMRSNGAAGFLGELLPLRVTGERDVQILWWKRRYRFEVVLNGAESRIEETPDHQLKDVMITLSTTYATLQRVQSKKGHVIVGSKKLVKKVEGSATFDRISYSPENKTVNFRVADFSIRIKGSWFAIPFKLSAGKLEETLNHGNIPVAGITDKFPIGLDKCINTQYIKFKSWAESSCDPNRPNVQLIGWLSFTPRPDSTTNYQYILQVDPNSIRIARGAHATHIYFNIVDAK